MTQPRPAVHRTILVVDIEGFGDTRRTRPHQVAMRDGLYRSLQRAFGAAGIAWDSCGTEDRGDGVLILAPPEVAKRLFAERLPGALAGALRGHNQAHGAREQIRLRMALHAGEVSYDEHGVTATSVTLAFRLVDAPQLKAALAASSGVLAVMVSAGFFDEVVRHSPLADPAAYRPVNVTVQETVTAGWICLPDYPYPVDDAILTAAPATPVTAAPRLPLIEVADQLAAAVGRQWKAEAAVRRLNDPYPLPVRWVAAEPSLVDDWPALARVAASGAGWPAGPPGHLWAAGPDQLAGEDDQLVAVLARVPTGRLVVLGEPGAGKTMLMVRLVLGLLARRAAGDPVPVLVPVASWDPAGQELRGWLEARLSTDYPWLTGPAPPGGEETTRIRALLGNGLITPILDGLDEIPEAVRGPAIARINDAIRPGEHLVVTSRTAQWRQAVRPPDGIEVTLRAAAGISLCPLDPGAVAAYLRADAGGPAAEARWDPVLAAMGTQPLLARVLSSPLMAGLARIVYNPRPGEHHATLPDPAELCGNPAAEAHLLDAFIPAAYRTRVEGRTRRRPASPQQAEKWLIFLARHLENTVKTPDFAWWQLGRAPGAGKGSAPGFELGIGVLLGGMLAALFRISANQPAGGWLAGLGILVALTGVALVGLALSDRAPSNSISWADLRRPAGLGAAVVVAALLAALVATLAAVPAGLLRDVLWVLLSIMLLLALVKTLRGVPGNLGAGPSPQAVLIRDRRTGLPFTLLGVLLGGLKGGLGLGLARGIAGGLLGGLVGLAAGMAVSGLVSAWPQWVHARARCALWRRLPWRLMTFLADAHQRGVLRQDGAVYQFRHIELQHRLAHRDDPSLPPPE